MDIARTLASGRFFLLCLIGLVAVAVLAIGIPQGQSDQEVLSTYPLSVAPFIVLSGLHRVGLSPVLWAVLVALLLHGGAVFVVRRTSARLGRGEGSKAWLALVGPWLLVALSVAGLVWFGGTERPKREPDPTRLRVYVRDLPGSQSVEEGAMYEVPQADGPRTLLFGVTSRGPYALERTHDGRLRVHLPGLADESRPSVVGVEARRPPAMVPDGGRWVPPLWASRWAGVLWSIVAAVAVLVLSGRGPALAVEEWRRLSWLAVSLLVLLVFNPFAGLGRAEMPLRAAGDGEEVAWAAVVTGPGAVAPWLALFPVQVRIWALWWLNLSVASALVLVVAAVLMHPNPRRFPSGSVRVLSGLGAGLATIGGVAWLAVSVGRWPVVASSADLLTVFHDDLLPRIPSEFPVLSAEVTSPGPYHVPAIVGFHAAFAAIASALLLGRLAIGRAGRTGPGPSVVRVVSVLVLAVAALRCGLTIVSAGPEASGQVPFSLIALLVAALGQMMARGHPDRPSLGIGTMIAAAGMQLAMPL